MPLEDLDLEFEDEEEQKTKKSESLAVDVDLEFGPGPEEPAKAPAVEAVVKPTVAAAPAPSKAPSPAAPAPPGTTAKAAAESGAQIKKIERPAAAASSGARPTVSGNNALQLVADVDSAAGLPELATMLEETRFEARVQVAVAEHRLELLADVLSDAKLLDHQVHQLLVRINQKHPELKPEVMAIKKLLADFAAKKRK